MLNTLIIDCSKVHVFWEILAEQTFCIFIQASFPGMIRVSKVDVCYFRWGVSLGVDVEFDIRAVFLMQSGQMPGLNRPSNRLEMGSLTPTIGQQTVKV
ncbi:MAG: hypothetical protein JRE28_03950 [Deltaproteobacteria bacterium]|nr:hypothetical protein [Deltaproteobacteria bacterium]